MKNNGAEMMIKELFPLASLITPNIPEAEILSGCEIKNKQDMEAAAEKLSDLGAAAVLLKGGHSISDADDLLCVEGQKIWIRGRRIHNPNTHGTGCTLSSAIASNLAKGMETGEGGGQEKQRNIFQRLWKPDWTWEGKRPSGSRFLYGKSVKQKIDINE